MSEHVRLTVTQDEERSPSLHVCPDPEEVQVLRRDDEVAWDSVLRRHVTFRITTEFNIVTLPNNRTSYAS